MPAFTDREHPLCRLVTVASVCCSLGDDHHHLVVLSLNADIGAAPWNAFMMMMMRTMAASSTSQRDP